MVDYTIYPKSSNSGAACLVFKKKNEKKKKGRKKSHQTVLPRNSLSLTSAFSSGTVFRQKAAV